MTGNEYISEKSTQKNMCFGRFYSDILDSIYRSFDEINDMPNIAGLIVCLSKGIHEWDDLLDLQGIPVNEARNRVYTKLEKDNIIEKINETLEIDFTITDLDKCLDEVEEYFLYENISLMSTPTEDRIINMLHKGNCDFRYYNSVFYKHIEKRFGDRGKELVTILDEFLTAYLKLDLLLDHITDIDEDIQEDSFNTLIWALKDKISVVSINTIHKELYNNGIYDSFNLMAKEFITDADFALYHLKSIEHVYALLKEYRDGEVSGLESFISKKGYTDLPEAQRREQTIIDLKPVPWNRQQIH